MNAHTVVALRPLASSAMGHVTPLGVQQYICCYFTLELDKVSQQSLMSNIFRILDTMVTCISCHFMRVTQINSMSFCALLAPNSGDATAYGGIEY